jgi:uncharacterized membrane protein
MSWALLSAGLLMALVAGVFLSFSDFVMRGLAQAPDATGAEGMVGLNRTVYRSIFMVLLIGFAPVALGLAGLAVWRFEGAAAALIVAGAAAYLLGVFAVTGMGNVPMNQRLDALALGGAGYGDYWQDYARRWTSLNHIRTAASTFAAAAWLCAANLV